MSLSPTDPLQRAIDLTLSTFQSDFAVCDGQRLVGLLTYARMVEALNGQGPDVPVGQVMQTDIAPVGPRDELFRVQQRMTENKLAALPVVEAGRFLGLITNRDVGELYSLASSWPAEQPLPDVAAASEV